MNNFAKGKDAAEATPLTYRLFCFDKPASKRSCQECGDDNTDHCDVVKAEHQGQKGRYSCKTGNI